MVKKIFKISGMHCSSCSLLIEGELEDIGVKARCDYVKQTVNTEYDPDKINDKQIIGAIQKAGYNVVE